MTGLTADGFEPKKLPQIKIDLEEGLRSILGSGATLLPDSPEGQMITLWATSMAEMWEELHNSYSAFNPLAVSNQDQDDLYLLNGLIRKPPAPSEVTLSITGTDTTVIPADSEISHDTSGAIFVTQDAVIIGDGFATGTAQVLAKAKVNGETVALAGSLTVIETPVSGWDTITNAADAVLGRLVETNAEFSSRREVSLALAGKSILDSMVSAVQTLSGVSEVKGHENATDAVDGLGLPEHSTELVVLGGDDNQISQAIWSKKAPGIESFGNTTGVAIDIFEGEHDIDFERPTTIDIWIRSNITFIGDIPSNADEEITQNILDYVNGLLVPGVKIGISDDVFNSRMYTPINLSFTNHTINSLEMSLDGAAWDADDIVIAHNEIAIFDEVRIALTIA